MSETLKDQTVGCMHAKPNVVVRQFFDEKWYCLACWNKKMGLIKLSHIDENNPYPELGNWNIDGENPYPEYGDEC